MHRGTERYHPAMCTLSCLSISFAAQLVCVFAAKRECIMGQTPSEHVAISKKSAAVHQPPGTGLAIPLLSDLLTDTA